MARASLVPETSGESPPIRAAGDPGTRDRQGRACASSPPTPSRQPAQHRRAAATASGLLADLRQPAPGTDFPRGRLAGTRYVYMLRGASSVTPRELLKTCGEADGRTCSSPRPLSSQWRLQHARTKPERPGRRVFRDLAPKTIRTRDRYGGYPPVAVLCHGSFWREAVDELLQQVDAVCMDLSGFTRKNEGAAYELQRVVDRFPIERVLFLMDNRGSEKFLRAAIQRAWLQLAQGSPNAGTGLRRTQRAKTDRYHTIIQTNDRGAETGRQTRLVAVRSQTRGLAVLVPERPRRGLAPLTPTSEKRRKLRRALRSTRLRLRPPWPGFRVESRGAGSRQRCCGGRGGRGHGASAADLLGEGIDSQTGSSRLSQPSCRARSRRSPGVAAAAVAQPGGSPQQPQVAQPAESPSPESPTARSRPARSRPARSRPARTVAQPGVAQPGVAQPGVAQPGVAQPGVAQPGVAQPGVAAARRVRPARSRRARSCCSPELAQPGVAQPGVAQPGVAQPGVAQPGVAAAASRPARRRRPARSCRSRSRPAWSCPAGVAQPGDPLQARSRPARSRPARSRPARSRPARSRPARSRPARSRPARGRPARESPSPESPSPELGQPGAAQPGVAHAVSRHDVQRRRVPFVSIPNT